MKILSQEEQLYLMRSAIVLNNAAINLLQKGHTTKALRVLKNLVHFLQQATNVRSNASSKIQFSGEALQGQLQETTRLVASAQERSSIVQVQVLDDDDHAAKDEACLYGPSASIVFCLRLNDGLLAAAEASQTPPSATAAQTNLANFEYMTCVILYNFGSTYKCAYFTCSAKQKEKNSIKRTHANLLMGAIRSLRSTKMLLLGFAHQKYRDDDGQSNVHCDDDDLYQLYQMDLLLQMLRGSLEQMDPELKIANGNYDDYQGHAFGSSHSAVSTSFATTTTFTYHHDDDKANESQQQQQQRRRRIVHPEEAEFVQTVYKLSKRSAAAALIVFDGLRGFLAVDFSVYAYNYILARSFLSPFRS